MFIFIEYSSYYKFQFYFLRIFEFIVIILIESSAL